MQISLLFQDAVHSYSGGLDNTLKSFDFNTTKGKKATFSILSLFVLSFYCRECSGNPRQCYKMRGIL